MSKGRVKGDDPPRPDLSTLPKAASIDIQQAYALDIFGRMAVLARSQGDLVGEALWNAKIEKLKSGTLFEPLPCQNCGCCIDCKYN